MVDDDDGDESPSPEPRTGSRSALPREIRAWRRLRVVKRDATFSLIFCLRETEDIELELRSVEVQGAHEIGGAPYRGRPPLSPRQALGPLVYFFRPKILINSKKCLSGFPRHSENFSFLHIKQHHGSSTENNVSPG